MWGWLEVLLDFIWWRSEDRDTNPVWHAIAIVSFWGGVVGLIVAAGMWVADLTIRT